MLKFLIEMRFNGHCGHVQQCQYIMKELVFEVE